MLSILRVTGRLVAYAWPQLLACFLAGWLTHYVLIEVAAFAGATNTLLGLAILPLAILARLVSFIAMFYVLRGAMPAFASLEAKGQTDLDLPTRAGARRRMSDILLVSIVPFFAFYAAWRFLMEDTQQYAVSALANLNPFADDASQGTVLDLRLDAVTAAIVVLAFVARHLLGRYEARLPGWTRIAAVYFEALWVYFTVLLISTYLEQLGAWFSSRAIVAWYEEVKEAVLTTLAPLGWLWTAVEGLVAQTSALVLLPLAWLTIAGVIYSRALALDGGAEAGLPYYERLRLRVGALPRGVARRAQDLGGDLTSRWRPLANAAVLIWRAGVVPMGFFVLVYTVLEAISAWALFGVVRLIGPHELHSFWFTFDQMLMFGVELLLEPLRIALIAAAYDYCLRKLEERRDATALIVASAGTTEATPRPRS